MLDKCWLIPYWQPRQRFKGGYPLCRLARSGLRSGRGCCKTAITTLPAPIAQEHTQESFPRQEPPTFSRHWTATRNNRHDAGDAELWRCGTYIGALRWRVISLTMVFSQSQTFPPDSCSLSSQNRRKGRSPPRIAVCSQDSVTREDNLSMSNPKARLLSSPDLGSFSQ